MAIFPNSAGWKEIGPEPDAEVGAVDLLADPGHARQQEQQQAAGRDRVAVALEHAEVAQEDDRRREQHEPDDEPLRLLARELLVDPVDDHQPEAGEHRDEREQVRVRVGQREADHEVPGEAQAEERRAVGQRDVRELLRVLDEHRREAGGEQERGGDEREQLAVAGAHSSLPRSRARTRSSASSRDRSWWSVNVARRAGGTCVERHAGRVPALVEVDAERQLVGQAAEDGDGAPVARVRADEVDGAGGEPGADQEREDQAQQQQDRPAAGAPALPAPGPLAAGQRRGPLGRWLAGRSRGTRLPSRGWPGARPCRCAGTPPPRRRPRARTGGSRPGAAAAPRRRTCRTPPCPATATRRSPRRRPSPPARRSPRAGRGSR